MVWTLPARALRPHTAPRDLSPRFRELGLLAQDDRAGAAGQG
jgi:hypothetical protein